MAANLDRFDRMLLGAHPASPTRATFRTAAASFVARATARAYTSPEHEPTVITSKRPARHVDHMDCPLCGVQQMGIEFHGELRDGTKVHQLGAHSAEKRAVVNGQPRCLGAGLRVEFVSGEWRGAKP